MAQSKQKYKVTGKRPASKSSSRSSSGRATKDAFRKESAAWGVFKQFVPFILFIIALLITISFFVKDFGAVGNFIRDNILFGIFSVSLYFLPVLLVAIGVLLLADTEETHVSGKIWCCIITFLLIDVVCHLLFAPDAMAANFNPFEHYKLGIDKTGGGFVGGLIGGLLTVCFSKIGAFIIVAASVIILVMVMLKKTPKDAALSISNSMKEKRERRAAEREEMEKERLSAARGRKKTPAGTQLTLSDAERIAEEERLEAERIAASADYYDDYDGFDDGYGREDYGAYDPYTFDGERKTEFDPTITDEDFPIEKKDGGTVLQPVAEAHDPSADDEASDSAIFDGLDDDEILDKLSKTYLSGEGLRVEENDLSPTLDNGEVVDIPAEPQYVFPDVDLLIEDTAKRNKDYRRELEDKEAKLIQTLEKFNVHTESAGLPSKGPTITRYELRPAPGTRVRAIVNLVDDIALSLATSGIRIEAPIPGKSAVGIEVPNDDQMIVRLRTLIDSDKFRDAESRLTVALGEDVAGAPIFFDVSKMPHLLIAGATGMGKSVCINCIIMSLLFKATPDEVKLILVDPKKVEFNMYEGLPHLIVPVVSDPKKAAGALSWAVNEMERRFGIIEEAKVRNITGYNELAKKDPEKTPLPHVVIIIDELADLMMTAPDSVENSIARLAQKARAAGMHLIIGTQRPSVDVITGTIKNNIPSRIACKVSSQIDSRTIIDTAGAEKLIGKGDMLFNPVGAIKPIRVQGAFVTDAEIDRIVDFIKENNNGEVGYNDDVMSEIETEAVRCTAKKRELAAMEEAAAADGDEDPMFWRAVELAIDSGKISTSLIQRKCSLGFGRAAKLIDRMEERGFVSAPDGQKPRQVLITRERLQEIKMGASVSADDDIDDDASF